MLMMLANLNEIDIISLHELKPKISYSHSALEQAASNLVKLKLITAQRGPGGGYQLNQPLDYITMGMFVPYAKKQQPMLRRALELLSDVTVEEFVKPFIK